MLLRLLPRFVISRVGAGYPRAGAVGRRAGSPVAELPVGQEEAAALLAHVDRLPRAGWADLGHRRLQSLGVRTCVCVRARVHARARAPGTRLRARTCA